MTVTYKLETFEGPLDLLLHLIDKAEIDIHEVSISEITDQYMSYLQAMQELELEGKFKREKTRGATRGAR